MMLAHVLFRFGEKGLGPWCLVQRMIMEKSCRALALMCLLCVGCGEPPSTPLPDEITTETEDLSPRLRRQVARMLRELCGLLQAPHSVFGDGDASLKLGFSTFQRYCTPCHGALGNGQGIMSEYLDPRPRNFRRGVFKFVSTPYGSKPLRNDLLRTVRHGLPGTAMPAFAELDEKRLAAVVDYVLALAVRGELEIVLSQIAFDEDEVDPELAAEMHESLLEVWRGAEEQAIQPLSPEPPMTAASIQAGRSAFLLEGCAGCHGADGRGRTRDTVGDDAWGRPSKPWDLTLGTFRGGPDAEDLYLRIAGGISGTPMPGYLATLQERPETLWHLVHFVRSLPPPRVLPDTTPPNVPTEDTN